MAANVSLKCPNDHTFSLLNNLINLPSYEKSTSKTVSLTPANRSQNAPAGLFVLQWPL